MGSALMAAPENEKPPRVSVLLPVYNDARYLRASIDSILAQTFSDFELIVVDDGSVDETPHIISKYLDRRVRVIRNECNLGLAPSLNRAIAASRGEYLGRQDADDISLPQRFARQVRFLDSHPLVGVVGSRAVAIDEEGGRLHLMETSCSDIEIKWDLLFFCPFVHSSVMIRRSVLKQIGSYTEDPEIFRAFVEDYDLWSRINQVALSANLPEPLLQYRYRRASASARAKAENERQLDRISRRNICRLLGRSEIAPEIWSALKGFFPDRKPDNADMGVQQLRTAVEILIALENAFCSKYVSEYRQSAHRLWQHSRWTRRCLVLAANKKTDASLRQALIFAAIKLFILACR